MQELPSAQEVAPVHPLPPQRPQRETTDVDVEAKLGFTAVVAAAGAVLLVVVGAFAEVVDAATVLELALFVLEAIDEEEGDEDETTLATSAFAAEALEEEESLPTPALVFRAVTSATEVAFQTDLAEPTAVTAAVSLKDPKSPEPDTELIWQARPRAAEHDAASPVVGTLKRPLVSLRVAAETGALQSWKTLPSIRILAPASTSKLWLGIWSVGDFIIGCR